MGGNTVEQGPPWLTIDAATGILSGTPAAAGKAEVVVTATIDREVRRLDERVGVAAQRSVIEAQ